MDQTKRKPPFNGSIFGKRSVLPVAPGAYYSYLEAPTKEITGEQLAYLLQQQATFVQASIDHCLKLQKLLQDDTESNFCSDLIEIASLQKNGVPRTSVDVVSDWFNQLVLRRR